MKSRIIAISAISAGLITIALTIGSYVPIGSLFALVVTSLFVILPLYNNSYKGAFLCYLAGGILSFLCSGLNYLSIVYPTYILYFGIYPIVMIKLKESNKSKAIISVVGFIWTVLFTYLTFFYYTMVLGGTVVVRYEIIQENIMIFLGIASVIFFGIFTAYVFFIKNFLDKYIFKVIKR